MAKQEYYRASVDIVEQTNGFYTVTVYERWENGVMPEPVKYPNMSWAEVKDVVIASFDIFSDSRTRRFNKVTNISWNQASIFD